MLCIILLCSLNSAAAQVFTYQLPTTNEENVGPVVNVFCGASTDNTITAIKWTFNSTTLAIDDTLGDAADPLRHSVTLNYRYDDDDANPIRPLHGSLLQIKNALKQDEGRYVCNARVTTAGGRTSSTGGSITVTINQYLPPVGFPKCTIEPSTTLSENTDTTFICAAGESSPPVNLRLILQTPNGSHIELGNTDVTRQVTMDYDNSIFVCYMTSETFPTAPQHMCQVGPITVSTEPLKTTTPKAPTTPQKTTQSGSEMPHILTTTMMNIHSTDKKEHTSLEPSVTSSTPSQFASSPGSDDCNSMVQPYVWGIVGGIIGVIITTVIFIITIVYLCHKYEFKTKTPNENITMTASSNQPPVSSADHAYMTYQRDVEPEPYTDLNISKLSSSGPEYQNKHHDNNNSDYQNI